MILTPGAITNQALAQQIRDNAAIEKDLMNIGTVKPCGPYMVPSVYQTSQNK